MDYYAFEYSVLTQLQDIFSISSLEIIKEETDIFTKVRDEFGNLENKRVLKFTTDNSIKVMLVNDFHISLSRNELVNAYENKIKTDEVVNRVRKYIENKWLEKIYR